MNIIEACRHAKAGAIIYSKSRETFIRASRENDDYPEVGTKTTHGVDYSDCFDFGDMDADDWEVL